jgi:hypothetical protein
MPEPTYIDQGAKFSPCRKYRYRLWRHWDALRPRRVAFVMLNPSTADETKLDPTLRRCLGFAQAWGYGGFEIVNLFALRSTDPAALRGHADPVGPENDAALLDAAIDCNLLICGWGVHGTLLDRARLTEQLLGGVDLHALRLTQAGAPGHPLYLPADLKPVLYRKARGV